jgi:CHAT domain-containing protein
MKHLTLLLLLLRLSGAVTAQQTDLEKADSLLQAGYELSQAFDFTQALALYKQALMRCEQSREPTTDLLHTKSLQCRNALANCYYANYEDAKADSLFRKAIAAANLYFKKPVPDLLISYAGLGVMQDREIAVQYIESAKRLYEAFGMDKKLSQRHYANAFTQIGIYYMQIEHHAEALHWYRKALAFWDESQPTEFVRIARLYNLIGLSLFNAHNDYPQKKIMHYPAIRAYQKGIDFLEKATPPANARGKRIAAKLSGLLYGNIGTVYGDLIIRDTNEVHRPISDKTSYDSTIHYQNIGIQKLDSLGDSLSLVHAYRTRMSYEHGYHREKVSWLKLAHLAHQSLLYNSIGLRDTALLACPKPEEIDLNKIRNINEFFQASQNKREAFTNYYRQTQDKRYLDLAIAHSRLLDAVFERAYQAKRTEQEKIDFIRSTTNYAPSYNLQYTLWEEATHPVAKMQRLNAVFEAGERAKELILVNQISEEQAKANTPLALRQEADSLRRVLNQHYRALQDSLSLSEEIRLREAVIALLPKQRAVNQQINAYMPPLARASQRRVISIPEIQAKLQDSTAVLSYLPARGWVDSPIWCVVIRRDTAYLVATNFAREDEKLIKEYKKISRNNNDQFGKQQDIQRYFEGSTLLYQKLIAPIEPYLLGINRLLVIDDVYTAQLPLQNLLTALPQKPDYSDVQYQKQAYLFQLYCLSQYTSATLAFADSLWQGTRQYENAYLGIAPFDKNAHPIHPKNLRYFSKQAAQLAYKQPEKQMGEFIAFRSINLDKGTFMGLPHSQFEVKNTARFLAPLGRVKALIGEQANEAAVKQALQSSFRIIHFATHIYPNTFNYDFSAIALAQPPKHIDLSYGEPTEDGLFFTNEIALQKYQADCVVLSGCETGTGYVMHNSSEWSLARYFMQAGVPNVIFTHWKVADKPTSHLMQLFFQYVAQGYDYAKALQLAQIQYLSQAKGNEALPCYWAGFTARCKEASPQPSPKERE